MCRAVAGQAEQSEHAGDAETTEDFDPAENVDHAERFGRAMPTTLSAPGEPTMLRDLTPPRWVTPQISTQRGRAGQARD